MSKPRDRTGARLKQEFDDLADMETMSTRKDIREARRQAKHHMTKHNRNQEKRALRDALYNNDEE